MKTRITANMLSELRMSEADTYEPDGEDNDAPRAAMVAAICAAEDSFYVERKSKGEIVLDLNELAAEGMAWALEYDLDKWADWGREGVPFTRAGQRIMAEIEATFPAAFERGVRRFRSPVAA